MRENIFKALDIAPSKVIQSALCSVIYNIAEVDFPNNWKNSIQEVGDRIKQSISNEGALISGLLALKQIMQSNEFTIDEERVDLNQLVEVFFPLLEQVMSEVASTQTPNQLLVMHLISKIFFSANNVSIHPFLTSFSIARNNPLLPRLSPAHLPLALLLPLSLDYPAGSLPGDPDRVLPADRGARPAARLEAQGHRSADHAQTLHKVSYSCRQGSLLDILCV